MAKSKIYVPDKSELALAGDKPHLREELLAAIETHDGVELAGAADDADLSAYQE